MFHKYNQLLKTYPYRTNMLTTGILFGTGDCVAQYFFPHEQEDGTKPPHDWHRTLRAWTYGTLFFSPIAVLWYGKTLPFIRNPFISIARRQSMSPKRLTIYENMFRIGLDQLFVPAFVWIPMYNVVMSCLAFHEKPLEVAKQKLEKNWWNILKTNWAVWPLFQVISFTFIPIHLRVVAANVGSVGWNCFLSTVHNAKNHFKNNFLETVHELDESNVNFS